MPRLTLALLSDEELQVNGRPELCIRLLVEDIAHDPTGREPPGRLELRLSPRLLRDLVAQGRAVQKAQVLQARARAERETARERSQATAVAADGSRVDTGVIERVVVGLHEYGWPPDAAT